MSRPILDYFINVLSCNSILVFGLYNNLPKYPKVVYNKVSPAFLLLLLNFDSFKSPILPFEPPKDKSLKIFPRFLNRSS